MTIHVTVPEVGNAGVTYQSDRTTYLQSLLNLRSNLALSGLPADTIAQLQAVRDRTTARVQELTIPSTRQEEWRFTDLSRLLQLELQEVCPSPVERSRVEPFLLPETPNRLVFIDGVFAPELSTVADLPVGVVVTTLLQSGPLQPRLIEALGQQPGAEEVFTALNTASVSDAAVVTVAKNQSVDVPIHLLFVATEGNTIAHPRSLVMAEMGSQLTLVEEYVTLGEGAYFTNPVTEIWIEENADVRHNRVQRDSANAFHIGKTAVSQARDSRYTCNAISLGAQLSRHNLEVYQTGEQTSTTLNGLSIISGEQVADTHSLISLTKPYGTSDQVHKTIVGDRAHAVFNGKIWVPQAAQQTNAAQLSRNLLLSPKARVDTKPQLEITADNVKCAHGATVSQLEDDEIFYLQSRGIDREQAQKLLVYAFAHEVIEQVPVESLRKNLLARVTIDA